MPKSPTTSIPPRSLLQVITIIGLPFVTSGQPIWKCSNDSAGTPIIYGHVRSYIPLCLHTSKFEIERDEKRKKRKTGNKDRKKKNWKECWSSVSQVPKDPYTTEGDGRRGVIMMERRIVMIMLTPLWISPPPCLLFPPPPWCNQVERRITIYIYIFFWDLFFVSLFVCRWVFFFSWGGARGPVMDREALFSARALSSPLLWEFREFASPFGNCVAPPPPPFLPSLAGTRRDLCLSVSLSACYRTYGHTSNRQKHTHTHG